MDSNHDSSNPRFKIALSFPGEHRAFVEQVAELLAQKVGRGGVLYDKYHEQGMVRSRVAGYSYGRRLEELADAEASSEGW